MPSTNIDESTPLGKTIVADDDATNTTKPPLNRKNWLNLVAYILNVTLVYGIGNAGWLGTPTNGELSDKYQTLVTPSSSAFTIWSVIFLFQAAFAVCQLLPRFRAMPMVQGGVSYWYNSATACKLDGL